jgi:hypothetical protein
MQKMMSILAVQDEKHKMMREVEKMEKNKCVRNTCDPK